MAEETGPTSHAHVKLCGHIDERESKAMMEDSNQSSSLELFSFVAYATRDRKACHRHHVLHRLHALLDTNLAELTVVEAFYCQNQRLDPQFPFPVRRKRDIQLGVHHPLHQPHHRRRDRNLVPEFGTLPLALLSPCTSPFPCTPNCGPSCSAHLPAISAARVRAGGHVDEDGARDQAGESSFGGIEGDSADVGTVADDEEYDIAGARYGSGGTGQFGTPIESVTPVPIQPIQVVIGYMVDLSREQRPWRSTDSGSRSEGGGDGGGTPGSERASGV
nr:PREDICTED: uncharacterized protein LOC108953093 [Musa acuminata subsp. malaccensis]